MAHRPSPPRARPPGVYAQGRRRSPPARRPRVLVGAVVVAAVAVLAAAVAVVVVAVRHHPASGPPGSPSSTGTLPPSTATTTVPVVADGTYSVATTSAGPVVDDSVAGGPRSLPTEVWYPAASTAPGAAPATGGPFPLLVFSQGYDRAPATYAVLLQAWASAGFVVAAPTYPDTDPTGADRADLVHHVTDLTAVLATLRSPEFWSGTVLSGAVETTAVGIAGQSDGGDVSLAVAADDVHQVQGVKALAVLSGAEYKPFGGSYFTTPTPPLLVVQSDADTVNPPVCSQQIYDAAPTPKYYLGLLGVTHLAPYTQSVPAEQVVAAVTTDFFEATLEGRAAASSAMTAAGQVSGVSSLAKGGSQPLGTGICTTTA